MDAIPASLETKVVEHVSISVKKFVKHMWDKWFHLNVSYEQKLEYLQKLDEIIASFLYKEVALNTNELLDNLKAEIKLLEKEMKHLSTSLNVLIKAEPYTDGTPLWQYKKTLEDLIVDYRKELAERVAYIETLISWQDDICSSLGIPCEEIKKTPLPSASELVQIRDKLERLQAEKDKRIALFLERQGQIKEMMSQLGKKPVLQFEQMVCNSMSIDFPFDDKSLEKLEVLYKNISEELEEANEILIKRREHINKLWECLDVDLKYRSEFLAAHTGCSTQTRDAVDDEIRRLEKIKSENIRVIIEKYREDIKKFWQLCLISDQEINRANFMQWNTFNEDTLEMHERYCDELKSLYNHNSNIFELWKKRTHLWNKMIELEEAANKPGRYNNRGGELLREEKERKKVAALLPKIESELLGLAEHYEMKKGKPFTVKDKILSLIIDEEWAEWRNTQSIKNMARKAVLTPSVATPMHRPQSARGRITASQSRSTYRTALTTPRAAMSTRTSPVKRLGLPEPTINLRPKATRRQLNLNTVPIDKENTSSNSTGTSGNNSGKIKVPTLVVNGKLSKSKRRASKRLSGTVDKKRRRSKSVETSQSTMSYSHFKEHLNDNVSSRSSVVPKSLDAAKHMARLEVKSRRIGDGGFATPQPRPRQLRQHTELSFSPRPLNATARRRSRSANNIQKNKDLPIIF